MGQSPEDSCIACAGIPSCCLSFGHWRPSWLTHDTRCKMPYVDMVVGWNGEGVRGKSVLASTLVLGPG